MANVQGNDKKITIADIGERLRQAREKRGLTLEQVQKQTHIHSTVLTALEDGRCDDILTPNYVKSFLKEYAGYLGFDHEALVGEYLTIHPELKGKNINFNMGKIPGGPYPNLGRIVRIGRSVIIFFLAISLVIFVSVKTAAFLKNSKAVKKAPISKYAKAAPRENPAAPRAASQKKPFTKNVPFTMTLKVRNPVMVQLKKDGVIIFKRVLPKGMEEAFAANNTINMFVGRAEAIEIAVNGKSLGSPGRGVMRNIEVTSNGVKVR
ncbi:MAG: RodZ domain-containing protein [Candidatus Omnitrophota bacterium]